MDHLKWERIGVSLSEDKNLLKEYHGDLDTVMSTFGVGLVMNSGIGRNRCKTSLLLVLGLSMVIREMFLPTPKLYVKGKRKHFNSIAYYL